jgi:hypothetical protein
LKKASSKLANFLENKSNHGLEIQKTWSKRLVSLDCMRMLFCFNDRISRRIPPNFQSSPVVMKIVVPFLRPKTSSNRSLNLLFVVSVSFQALRKFPEI